MGEEDGDRGSRGSRGSMESSWLLVKMDGEGGAMLEKYRWSSSGTGSVP